jgi:starch synthase
VVPATAADDLGLGSAAQLLDQLDLKAGHINFLKHGIVHADKVTTVSPTYAREIRTPQYGMGLETVLQARGDNVAGILNGVDYGEWSPETDRYLPHRYDAKNLAPKVQIKRALLTMLKLKFGERTPLIGIISRMARQKGFDLLFETLPVLMAGSDVGLIAVGNGEARYENFFASLQQRFPDKIHFHRGYHEEFAHLIEAGSDIFLMPSLYEPCGLNQMYSLRYGTVPVVRNTGGLADSVKHFDPDTGPDMNNGTGIVFNDFDGAAVMWALETALKLYKDRAVWERLMRNGMREDFSWEKQGALYVALYRSLSM